MAYGLAFDRLAKTIDKPDEAEIKIPATFRISESILASLNSIASATGVSKTEVINQVLNIGLTEFCEALQSRRDLVIEVRDDAYPVFAFFSPDDARRARARFGDAVQLDLEDAIEEQKQQEQTKPPTKGEK
jgi:hypothetical protein